MFELGSSLHEARVRRGLELAQVAAETRIRTRYLQALEDERFELLPGSVYAKGFLRAYADYLGLEARACSSVLGADTYHRRTSWCAKALGYAKKRGASSCTNPCTGEPAGECRSGCTYTECKQPASCL
jgi:hypothetical protein